MVRRHNFGDVLKLFLILHNKPRSTLKLYLLFFEKKFYFAHIDQLRSFFTVSLGLIKVEPSYCYYWVFKHSEHGGFHGYYWIRKQAGHSFSSQRFSD